MSKVNLKTLVRNAARARQALERQQEKVTNLSAKIVEAVGDEGRTFETSIGQVIVSAKTETRRGTGFNYRFDEEQYHLLPANIQQVLRNSGVVSLEQRMISGRNPTVSYRLVKSN